MQASVRKKPNLKGWPLTLHCMGSRLEKGGLAGWRAGGYRKILDGGLVDGGFKEGWMEGDGLQRGLDGGGLDGRLVAGGFKKKLGGMEGMVDGVGLDGGLEASRGLGGWLDGGWKEGVAGCPRLAGWRAEGRMEGGWRVGRL